jgi:hypothetical protein
MNTALHPRKESTRKKVDLVGTLGIFHLIILNTGSGVLCKDMLFLTNLDFSLRVFNYMELKNVEGGGLVYIYSQACFTFSRPQLLFRVLKK